MRFRSRSELLFGVIVLLMSGAVLAQNKAIIGVKDFLEDGSTLNEAFERGATAYLYAFDAVVGDVVTVEMTQEEGSDLDPFIVLLSPTGTVVSSDDDSGEAVAFSSRIQSVKIREDGTYLILATSYVYIDNILIESEERQDDQEANEPFALTVSGNSGSADPEANTVRIFAVPVAPGDAVDGQSSVETTVGFYTLEGEAGDRVSLVMESDDFDTILHVFNPEGERIAVNDDDEEGGTTNSAIRNLELPEDGTYLVMATNLFFYSAWDSEAVLEYVGGDYTLSVR
jgi:hypothetical protein